jgi:hypothetical protein
MRRVAQLMNIGVIGLFIYAVVTHGFPVDFWMDLILLYVLLVMPLVNTWALTWQQPRGWLGLWLQRKRLEEERRIERLQKEGDTPK